MDAVSDKNAIIPRTAVVRQTPAWQRELARAITDPAVLVEMLDLDSALLPAARKAAGAFPLCVPHGFVARMRKGDLHDPLLRQVLPLGAEHELAPGYVCDPVGDLAAMAAPGVLHKYSGRVLLTATGACAIHCRYCFRRHFPYGEANASSEQWSAALRYIERDVSMREAILSGGDPLTLNDRRLADFVAQAETIPHLRRLRIHTRLPVVLPERVDDALLAWMAGTRLKIVVVIHANHANEVDADVCRAAHALADAGATLLNQSVLLRGVNDSAAALAALSERLFEAGVLPYYLHLLDRVQGAGHFEVDVDEAQAILAGLRAVLPGYLVPRLVREEAGAPAKSPIA
jgi:EF-P beta-lysylation protein EpmB